MSELSRGTGRATGHEPGRDLGRETVRLDKWLFFARFAKSRALAVEMVEAGRMRLNGVPLAKAAHAVGPGDTLTFPQGGRIRVIRVLACGTRRGPAPEAQALYADLDPAERHEL